MSDCRRKLETLRDAVATFIMAVDELMVGPSTRERGERLALLLGRLQDAWVAAEPSKPADPSNADPCPVCHQSRWTYACHVELQRLRDQLKRRVEDCPTLAKEGAS